MCFSSDGVSHSEGKEFSKETYMREMKEFISANRDRMTKLLDAMSVRASCPSAFLRSLIVVWAAVCVW